MHEVKLIKKKKYSKKYFINFKDETNDYILLDIDTISKSRISVGATLSDTDISEALNKQNLVDAKQKAYSFVSYKPRSEYEVRKRLKDKEFDSEAIENAIEFLYKYKLLDDDKFVESYVRTYLERKPSGKFKLEIELKKKGLSEELIYNSISKIYDEFDLFDLAFKAAIKHQKKINYKPKSKQKDLVISFLKRRGFRWETITQVIDKMF
jgi:regulatory protein